MEYAFMSMAKPSGSFWSRLSCAVWGHVVDNEVFRRAAGSRRCRCGVQYLPEDGSPTHVRHTLSCFLRHHTYVRLGDRDGVHEYVCIRCGHPLVYPAAADPFAHREKFAKKVRYACGLLGHRVQAVAERGGFVEYACGCGHSFLKASAGTRNIRHPLVCFLLAHRIVFQTVRAGYAEYVCTDCGHPFCFVVPGVTLGADQRVVTRVSSAASDNNDAALSMMR
jgi:DNA-directed RNA polymerase subunit RPC12/RpoP